MKVKIKETWKKRKRTEEREEYEYYREGLMGKNHQSDNAHEVTEHYNFNGSGKDAFGGANQWCHVTAQINLQENQEKLRTKLGQDLRDFIDRWLKNNLKGEQE